MNARAPRRAITSAAPGMTGPLVALAAMAPPPPAADLRNAVENAGFEVA